MIFRAFRGFIVLYTIKNVGCVNSKISRTMSHKVFVYGTLKLNEPNHEWLTTPENGLASYIGEGTTVTKYPLIIATRYNIPFLLYSPGNGHNVKGEVYEVNEPMLTKLDELEDHPTWYVREIDNVEVKVKESNQIEVMKCWIYFLKKFRSDLLQKPTMDSYSSSGDHGLPYLERFRRDPNYDYKTEIRD